MTAPVQPARVLYGEGAYLQCYYDEHSPENRDLGEFLARTSVDLEGRSSVEVLDAGCGPTLLYWSLFLRCVTKLHGCDGDAENLGAVRRIARRGASGLWRRSFLAAASHAARLQGVGADGATALLRARLAALGDLRQVDLGGPWPYAAERFDHLVSCYALECLPTWDAFETGLREARRVVRTGGRAAFAMVARSDGWRCGDVVVPTLRVDGQNLAGCLERAGWHITELVEVPARDAARRSQDYDRVVFAAVRRG